MSITADASDTYNRAARALGEPRAIETQLFSRVTGALSRAAPGRDSDYPAFVAALSANLQLWTALAADVASDGNRLPTALRAQIFNLAKFTRLLTSRLLSGDRDADPQALIDVNLSILRGLRREPDAK
ncbi:MAG: flagellar biosynthesis regulator FlaF [Parvularculaceae bacterium]